MNHSQLEVSISLTNEKVQFLATSATNPERPITLDYLPPLGDGQGYRGLELLIMSFGSCVGTVVVGLLRRMEKNISGFKMNLEGIKKEQPLSLEKIHMEIILESDNTTDEDMQKIMKKAEEISPVWLAIKNNVEVITVYKIIA